MNTAPRPKSRSEAGSQSRATQTSRTDPRPLSPFRPATVLGISHRAQTPSDCPEVQPPAGKAWPVASTRSALSVAYGHATRLGADSLLQPVAEGGSAAFSGEESAQCLRQAPTLPQVVLSPDRGRIASPGGSKGRSVRLPGAAECGRRSPAARLRQIPRSARPWQSPRLLAHPLTNTARLCLTRTLRPPAGRHRPCDTRFRPTSDQPAES